MDRTNKASLAIKAMKQICNVIKETNAKIDSAKDENGVVLVDQVKTFKAMAFEEAYTIAKKFVKAEKGIK